MNPDYLIDPREMARVLAKFIWLPADIMRMIFDNLVRTRNIEMTRRNEARENRLYQMSHVRITWPGIPNSIPDEHYYYNRRYGPGY